MISLILAHVILILVLWIVLLDHGVNLTPALKNVVVALTLELVSLQLHNPGKVSNALLLLRPNHAILSAVL